MGKQLLNQHQKPSKPAVHMHKARGPQTYPAQRALGETGPKAPDCLICKTIDNLNFTEAGNYILEMI